MTSAKKYFGAKPEERELARKRRELEQLESELASAEVSLTSLRAELGSLERRYLKLVGIRYAELDELRAQIAERLAAADPTNERAQCAAREARARAEESRAAAYVKPQEETKAFSPTASLKRRYREIARRIHPDLTTNPADRAERQKLMAEANEAYEKGDERRLEKILEEYESSPETVEGEGPGAELVRVIRKISQVKSRLREIEMQTEQLLESELYQLKAHLEEAEREGRDLLREIGETVEERIAESRRRLESLAMVEMQ